MPHLVLDASAWATPQRARSRSALPPVPSAAPPACHPPAPPPSCPQEHLPPEKLAQVQGVLYGLNMGKPVAAVPLAPEALAAAEASGYDLQAYRFDAAPEQMRPPRVVRVGLVQNSIKLPTTAPFAEQRQVRGGRRVPWHRSSGFYRGPRGITLCTCMLLLHSTYPHCATAAGHPRPGAGAD